MAIRTREMIKSAFIELLDERPLSKITVKDVVTHCGVNRNTFYYYFADLPSLAEAVITEDTERIMKSKLSLHSIEDCLVTIISFTLEHRQAVLHLYQATDREQFELSQWRVCQFVIEEYMNTLVEGRKISESDRTFLTDHLRGTLFGWIMDWLRRGLKPDIQAQVHRMCQLKQGQMEEILERCEAV